MYVAHIATATYAYDHNHKQQGGVSYVFMKLIWLTIGS